MLWFAGYYRAPKCILSLPNVNSLERLRETKRRVDELRKRHTVQRRELEALMPSMLVRAFAGEL